MNFLPLRAGVSSGLDRRCRVVAPTGESLWCSRNFAARSERTPAARTFVAPNESNQSKGALHLAERCGYKLRPCTAVHQTRRTRAAISLPLASLRLGAINSLRHSRESGNPASEHVVDSRLRGNDGRGTRKVAQQRPHCAWAPFEPSSSAGLCGSARSAPQRLTSRRLAALSGAHPDAVSRQVKANRKAAQGFDTSARAVSGAPPCWIPAFAGMTAVTAVTARGGAAA
jgi:hypothetical protein